MPRQPPKPRWGLPHNQGHLPMKWASLPMTDPAAMRLGIPKVAPRSVLESKIPSQDSM